MEVKIDLMTKEEMLQESYINKGNRYTTEEWQENGDYVTTDRNGYLNYANGEEGDVDSYSDSGFYDNPLYDSDDEW